MPDALFIVTGYGAGRIHVRAEGDDPLRTACGRQLRDGIINLTASDAAQHYPGTLTCDACRAQGHALDLLHIEREQRPSRRLRAR